MGPEEVERFPHPKEPPHQQGDQLGQKENIWGCWKRVKQLVCGRQARQSMPISVSPSPHVSAIMHRGWVLEHEDWRANPGKGQLLDVRKQPEGTGVRKSTTRNASGGNLTGRRRKASLLTNMQGLEPPF